MYKKNEFNKLNSLYNIHLYTGINGIAMRYCHRNLESFKGKEKYDNVLEIGAGTAPHINYVKHKFDNYYIAETSEASIKHYENDKKISAVLYDGVKLPFENNFFDRIIIFQALEHINNPENFLFETMSKLKNGGLISISLPTDPGILWRLGKLFTKHFTAKRTYKISSKEYEYLLSTEHINSIFNLISLIRYNFENQIKENFLPFKIKLVDVNLFYNVHITK
jgi:SAM-dependent methyltransferase